MSASTIKLGRALLAGVLLGIGGGMATAAEGEPATLEAAPLDDNAETNADKTVQANAATSDGPPESQEVFLPTEEISEDFAVPFPVDI